MKNRGFTLIELLVVIAIVGILISGLVHIMNKDKNKTPKQICLEKIANWSLNDLPAGCLQYVVVPEWYKELEKYKNN